MLNHKGTVVLTTPRLTLRRLALDDARDMFDNWASDDRTSEYLSWETHKSVETTKEVLTRWIPEYDRLDYYHWVIQYGPDIIGTVNFFHVSDKDEKCEIGYCIGPKWWNIGVMTEAVGELFRFAFEDVNFYKIYAVHDIQNVGSGRVMQKNGMKQEGYLREHTRRRDGSRGDMIYYAVLGREWREAYKGKS